MILVLAGTKDGRDIAAEVARQGYQTLVSVVSDYGRKLAEEYDLPVSAGQLDEAGLAGLIGQRGITAVIDATHPYATVVSLNTIAACRQCGSHYLRYERPVSPLPNYEKLHLAADVEHAARLAAALGKVIFLTIGSRGLKLFKAEPLLAEHRLIARILPDTAVLAECLTLGFAPGDIVALQGPFSQEFNVALFRQFGSEVIVTKNSGDEGGAGSKFAAAIALKLPLVVIDRPLVDYGKVVDNCDDVIKFLKEVLP